MSETGYVERHNYRSECPRCGRFLTRSMVRISILGTQTEIAKTREHVQVAYGSETKCRRCKFIGKTEKVAEVEPEKQI